MFLSLSLSLPPLHTHSRVKIERTRNTESGTARRHGIKELLLLKLLLLLLFYSIAAVYECQSRTERTPFLDPPLQERFSAGEGKSKEADWWWWYTEEVLSGSPPPPPPPGFALSFFPYPPFPFRSPPPLRHQREKAKVHSILPLLLGAAAAERARQKSSFELERGGLASGLPSTVFLQFQPPTQL